VVSGSATRDTAKAHCAVKTRATSTRASGSSVTRTAQARKCHLRANTMDAGSEASAMAKGSASIRMERYTKVTLWMICPTVRGR
jgi:hypothetical protein